jgi:hypothetical protein
MGSYLQVPERLHIALSVMWNKLFFLLARVQWPRGPHSRLHRPAVQEAKGAALAPLFVSCATRCGCV